MRDFEKIHFIREVIADYSYITAMFLCGANNKFCISSANEIKSGDILGLTYYSMDSLVYLRKLRKLFPNNEIIVGGIGVFSDYRRILEIADYVYFGEGYNWDNDCVLSNKFEKDECKICTEIPFEKIPFVKVSAKEYYFQIERGCPYRCEYCYVAWCNPFVKMDDELFRKRITQFDKKVKGVEVKLVSNEGIVKDRNNDLLEKMSNKYDVASITLKMYLANLEKFQNQKIVRVGIELPTEELRDRILCKQKKIADTEMIDFITKYHPNLAQFFYIWNYYGTTEQDYMQIYEIVKQKYNFQLRLNFTTHEIQPFTPLQNKVAEHIEQLLSSVDFSKSKVIKKTENNIKNYCLSCKEK